MSTQKATKESDSTVIHIRIKNDLKKQLEVLAEKDRRSLSNFLAIALENLVKE